MFTFYGWLVCVWVLVVSFQYGYHISALNQIQATLTCRTVPAFTPRTLPTCIPMSDATFSLVTSVFTVGGFLGSTTAGIAMDRYGRKAALQISGLFTAIGAGLMGVAPSTFLLLVGRFLTGCGAGIGLCTGPIFLAEVAPSNIRGSVGVLTQLAIVFGIMITQLLGLRMATPTLWRFVLLFSFLASVVQLCLSRFIIETPVWLKQQGKTEESRAVKKYLLQQPGPPESIEDPLIDETRQEPQHESDDRWGTPRTAPISTSELLTSLELRRPLVVVSFAMICQQLSDPFPCPTDAGPYVSLGITLVNTLMTFPPIFLSMPLLLVSVAGALASLVLTGYGLNTGMIVTSSMSILVFVMSFAVGLGPIPFIIISEVAPSHAVSALSSVALSLNCMILYPLSFGILCLTLNRDCEFFRRSRLPTPPQSISGGDSTKEGRVFYFFAVLFYRPRIRSTS
ncbi:hypothetical protein BGW80DRAFT_1270347 [Lactifluus volemus]|nr:hypothetical protein BGW80DRAFT_1270347 [Lactifluus volemus]